MFAVRLYRSGTKKKELLKLSSESLLAWPSGHAGKDERFSHQGNTCWETLLSVACEQASAMASQVFRHSREHLLPLLRPLVCNVTISWKKDSRQERRRKFFWWILGSGRYQDALPQLCAPGFLEGAQGGRWGPPCWVLCSALSAHPSSALTEHGSMALK